MKKISTLTAKQFDDRFDRGEDISAFVDTSTIKRPGLEARRVNVDFPEWVIQSLGTESKLIGVKSPITHQTMDIRAAPRRKTGEGLTCAAISTPEAGGSAAGRSIFEELDPRGM